MVFIPAALAACTTFFSGVILSDITNFKVKHYSLKGNNLKKSVRFVQISDLHGISYGEGNKRLIEAVKKLHPDFVIMSGDIMSADVLLAKHMPKSVDVAESLISGLSLHHKIYFGLGNHEQKPEWFPDEFGVSFDVMMERFSKAGAVILDNSTVYREAEGISISGLSLPRKNYQKFDRIQLRLDEMEDILERPSEKYYKILIAHNPEYIDIYSDWGADLTLSGHYHGGIMQLPGGKGVVSPRLEIFPDHTGGYYHTGGHDQIVSRGLGYHTFPVRVFNPGELVCVDVVCS